MHALDILMTQVMSSNGTPSTSESKHTIKRLSKQEIKETDLPDVNVERYAGPPKPDMPHQMSICPGLSCELSLQQCITMQEVKILFVYSRH